MQKSPCEYVIQAIIACPSELPLDQMNWVYTFPGRINKCID